MLLDTDETVCLCLVRWSFCGFLFLAAVNLQNLRLPPMQSNPDQFRQPAFAARKPSRINR